MLQFELPFILLPLCSLVLAETDISEELHYTNLIYFGECKFGQVADGFYQLHPNAERRASATSLSSVLAAFIISLSSFFAVIIAAVTIPSE